MDEIIQFLREGLSTQFGQGAVVAMVVGGLMGALWKFPRAVLKPLVQRGLIVHMEVRHHEAVRWLAHWLCEHPYAKRAKRVLVDVETRGRNEPKAMMVPGFGWHLLRHDGRWLIFGRQLEEASGPLEALGKKEVLHLYSFGREAEHLRDIVQEAQAKAVASEADGVRVYVNQYSEWYRLRTVRFRPFDSVILSGSTAEEILSDTRRFYASEQRYIERGVPWRRGYLLHGPPGSGKSSIVRMLATEMVVPLYVLDLAAEKLTDTRLAYLLSQLPTPSMVLIEDLDCYSLQRDPDAQASEDASTVTMSGLLNALDGAAAGEGGRLVVATSNHPDRLDPALDRPGRIDRQFEIGHAVVEQAARLFGRFYPDASDVEARRWRRAFEEIDRPVSMAELQGMMMPHESAGEFLAACAEPQCLALTGGRS